jgi:hypothetical protein
MMPETHRKGRARCGSAILLRFSKTLTVCATQKDGQELPVRQTLPPVRSGLNSVKIPQNQAKTAPPAWHGVCDNGWGTKYSDRP